MMILDAALVVAFSVRRILAIPRPRDRVNGRGVVTRVANISGDVNAKSISKALAEHVSTPGAERRWNRLTAGLRGCLNWRSVSGIVDWITTKRSFWLQCSYFNSCSDTIVSESDLTDRLNGFWMCYEFPEGFNYFYEDSLLVK